MKQTFRLVHEEARENAIRAIQRAQLLQDKPVVVTVQPEAKRRSIDQNARYWAILQQAAIASGTHAEALHHHAKRQFLGYKEIELFGVVHEIPNSTAGLSTKQFAAYCEQVEAWLAQEGLVEAWR